VRGRRPAGAETPAGVLQGGHHQAVRQRVVPSRQALHRQRGPVRLQGPALSAAAGYQEVVDAARPGVRRPSVAAGAELSRVVLHHVHDRAERQSDRERDVQRAGRPRRAQRAHRRLGHAFRVHVVAAVRQHFDVPHLRVAVPESHATGLSRRRAHRIHVVHQQPGEDPVPAVRASDAGPGNASHRQVLRDAARVRNDRPTDQRARGQTSR